MYLNLYYEYYKMGLLRNYNHITILMRGIKGNEQYYVI